MLDRIKCIETQEKIKEKMRVLAGRRNSLAPISRLPPEILLAIFRLYAVTQPLPLRKQSPCSWWIDITYVCQHWRAIALSDPRLWICPPMFSEKWAFEMARRSGDQPLIIEFKDRIQKWRTLDLITQNIQRIAAISIRAGQYDIVPRLQGTVAPQLQTLELIVSGWGEYESAKFNVEAPSLRTLVVRGFPLCWDSQILRAPVLVSLELDCERGLPPTMGQLLNILGVCNKLQTLKLKVPLPHGRDENTNLEPHVLLPHLRVLSLESSCLSCAHLLDHLAYSDSVAVEVCFVSPEAISLASLTVLFAAIAKNHHRPQMSKSIERYSIVPERLHPRESWSEGFITIRGFTSSQLGRSQEDPPYFSLCLGSHDRDDIFPRLLPLCINALPMCSVKEIDLSHRYTYRCDCTADLELRSEDWLSMKTRLLEVTSIELCAKFMDELVLALLEDTHIILPRLEALTLLGVAGNISPAGTSRRTPLKLLAKALGMRQVVGLHLTTLEFVDWPEPSLIPMNDLKGVVGNVRLRNLEAVDG
ncbi:hypothetical protein JAAARDRAFT_595871 [Jaapia argillacea MUCL 33604]|uniref:Uncharacterized protein n=1 Tax=Jaapia argillacea MUCL 33604 TaxID=933084 RepID=A0A067PZ57_9AGAM|nr:hypothetical protein JAAARDRAFT_595871 [Jaapia argillacea MUCL 33604]